MTLIILGFLIIIFPIFCRGDIVYLNKKLFFKLCLLGIIPIFKCYAKLKGTTIEVYLFDKIKKEVKIKSVFKKKNNFKFLLDFHFLRVSCLINKKIDDNLFQLLNTSVFYLIISDIIGKILCFYKPYVSIYSGINLTEEINHNEFALSLTFVFNLLVIIINLIKIVLEKTFNERKVKQNQGSN